MTDPMAPDPAVIRDLGDGLILRRSTAADAEPLAEFNADIHGDRDANTPDEGVGVWTRDLLRGDHPTFGAGDFTIVEDTRTGKTVSSLNLISQTWTYDGIPFGVGRPELVATHPDYRNRGLVRAQFEVVHQWSAERGHKVQAITGIPFYYRQFGYEMALSLGGGRIGYLPHVPRLKPDQAEPYRVRPVAEADLPFLVEVDAHAAKRSLIACPRDLDHWRYELFGKSERNVSRLEIRIVETPAGEPAGVLGHSQKLGASRVGVELFELRPGVSWVAVMPSVLRYLDAAGAAYAEREQKPYMALAFWLGEDHPAFQVAQTRLPDVRRPYAWYLRVADLLDFVRHIAPALERRLAASVTVGHTGELKLSFYRDGLRLLLQDGKLAAVESWTPTVADDGSAAFPGRTFLQLLFGYRSLEGLRSAFPDCWVDNDDARALLNALFPQQSSRFLPI